MNGKHYLGKRVSSFDLYDEIGPITGVAMLIDDEHEVFAGDETGYVLEIECPYATQEMANAALDSVISGTYKGFSATNGALDIDAELGDGVTVNAVYSVLAHQTLRFGPGHMSDISAPGENVIDHEYPYLSPEERKSQRVRASMWSAIEKNAESITLEVGKIMDELENYSTIEMTAERIEFAVSESKTYTDSKTGEIVASLDNYSTIEQTANKITAAVTESKQYTDGRYETLSTEWEQTAEGFRASINGLDGKYTKLEATVNGFTVTDASGTTLISGSHIETGSLVLTGLITWDDLDSDVQSDINNRGISAGTARTLITSTLVSSPTIRGASFEDLDGDTKLILDPTGEGYADLKLINQNEKTVFSIYDNIGSATISLYGMRVLTSGIEATYPLGTWDFSNTNVIGVTAVFG